MFIVVRDGINRYEGDHSIKGTVLNGQYWGGKQRIRLLDDDGLVYFHLESDIDYVTGVFMVGPNKGKDATEEEMFYPLDTLGASYGCTSLEYICEEGKYTTL